MKKLLLVALAAVGMAACVQNEELAVVKNDAIAFDQYVNNATKVVDPSLTKDNIEDFQVWGYMENNTGTVFTGDEVTKTTSGWTYTNTQYWAPGKNYYFEAVAPANGSWTATTATEADITDLAFTNNNGTEDLLYTYQKVAARDQQTLVSGVDPVQLQFGHLLSKVQFSFKSGFTTNNVTINVSNVRMTVPAEATVALDTKEWDGHNGTLTLAFGNAEATLAPSATEYTPAQKALLTIPAPATQNYEVKFNVQILNGAVEALNQEVTSTISGYALEVGKAYNFTAVIGPEVFDLQPIEFNVEGVDTWDEQAPSAIGYTVSADGSYLVSAPEGLQSIVEDINAGELPADTDIVLNGDIDLSALTRSVSSNWTPLGSEAVPFTGTFDGKGYKISNLVLYTEESASYVGFFGYAKSATIKNVTFENVNVQVTGADGGDHIAAVVGVLATNDPDSAIATKSYVENVTVKGNIYIDSNVEATGSSRVAVVIGGNNNSDVVLKNVHVIANEGSYVKANSFAGGIVGQTNRRAYFENCTSNIDVTATRFFAGGIAGSPGNEVSFVNCHTTGDVTVTAGRSGAAHDHYRVGGIAGGWDDNVYFPLVLKNCSYTGKISGTNADGTVAEKFDYLGYVGRGYSVKNGSKVVIDGVSFVQTDKGVYEVGNDASGEPVVVNNAVELLAAVAKVADGDVIKLGADFSFTTEEGGRYNNGGWWDGLGYSGDKSFTLDLNNHTLGNADGALNDYLVWFKNDGSKANYITIKNGTLDAGTTAYCAIATSSSNKQTITINLENVTLINNNTSGAVAKIRAGAVLNVKAGTKIIGKNSYTGIECVASTVNIYEGAEIYQNGTSSSWGFLAGASWGGVINVYGGQGVSARGGFMAMTSGGTVNVHGGEWTANVDGTIGNNSNLYVLSAQNNKYESGYKGASIVNVTGGTFRGGMDAWVLNDVNVEKAELNISGGNFNANPKHYLAEGYAAVESNGIWNVIEAATVSTPEALAEAVAHGGYVVLAEDITLAETLEIAAGKEVSLNLNGKTLKGNWHKNNGAIVKNNGTLTLVGGTISSVGENGGSAIQNSGTMIVTDATLNGAPNANGSWPSYTVNNTGNLTLNKVVVTSHHGAVASYNENAVVTMNDCTINMQGIPGFTSHGIYTYNNGKVVVNGGNYTNHATDQVSSGASVINGYVEINAGIFSGRIENYYGTPVLKGGSYNVKPAVSFVAVGYKVVEADGMYVVVAE